MFQRGQGFWGPVYPELPGLLGVGGPQQSTPFGALAASLRLQALPWDPKIFYF